MSYQKQKGDYKMARRTKGEGTLRKRKDGRWEGWFNIGKDENGKTKRKSVTAKTKSECQEKLNKAKEEYLKEQSVLSSHTYLTDSDRKRLRAKVQNQYLTCVG